MFQTMISISSSLVHVLKFTVFILRRSVYSFFSFVCLCVSALQDALHCVLFVLKICLLVSVGTSEFHEAVSLIWPRRAPKPFAIFTQAVLHVRPL